MKKIIDFLKKDIVLVVAWGLALFSMIVIPPDMAYKDYVDVKTLLLLFCLMCVVAGWKELGLFDFIAKKMIGISSYLVQIVCLLVFLCFFFSMVITNDVALLTFVPLTLLVMEKLDIEKKDSWMIFTVVMQTVAANLGSMFTPIGNPQNLYLYEISRMDMGSFLKFMFPVTAVSFVGIFLMIVIISLANKGFQPVKVSLEEEAVQKEKKNKMLYSMYFFLFMLCLATVAHMVPVAVTFVVVLCACIGINPKVLRKVDYSLLLVFVGFFLFIGNLGRIEIFKEFLQHMIEGREVVTAILASQITSNVPAALLLSGFTQNVKALILGTNLGGLGTMIASMASLISYKCLGKAYPRLKGKYFIVFTGINVFLLFLLGWIFV